MKKKTAFILLIITVISILAAFSIYEHVPEKKKGDKLVIAFGDSLTYGTGDENGSGYIDTLESRLNKQNKEDFVFINEGVYGLETSGVLKKLADVSVSKKVNEADHIILFIGTNDLLNSNGGTLKNLKMDAIEKGKAKYLQNLTAIIRILRESNEEAPILLIGLYNPIPESEEIETIIDDWNNEIKGLIQKEERIIYIPTNDLFKGKKKQEYFSDPLHLNDKGYKLLANRIMERYEFK